MTRTLLAPLAALAIAVLAPAGAHALTVAEAMEAAVGNHELAELAELAVVEADANRRTALGGVLPTATTTVTITRNDREVSFGDSTFTNLWDTSGTLRVGVDLFRGPAYPALAAARRNVEGAEASEQAVAAELRRAAARGYVAALSADAVVQTATEAVALAEASLERTEALRDAGYAVDADVSRARLAVSTARADLLDAELARQDALAQLAFAVVRDDVTQSDLMPVRVAWDGVVLDEAAARGPDVEVAESAAAAAEASWRSARWELAPTAGVEGQVSQGPESLRAPDGRSWSVVFTLRWVLFDYARYGRMDAAQARMDAAEVRLSQLERERAEAIDTAARALAQADLRLQLAHETADVAEENRALLQQRFELGDATVLEMTEADAEVTRAQISLDLLALQRDLALIDLAWYDGRLDDAQRAASLMETVR